MTEKGIIRFLTGLGLILIALKLLGLIPLPWLLVLSPFYLPLLVISIAILIIINTEGL